MLKKIKVLLAFLSLLFGMKVFAGNCATYPSFFQACGCRDSSSVDIAIGYWRETTDGSNAGQLSAGSKVCANENDTVCNETVPSTIATGDVLYVKNISSGATDYFKCEVTLGQSLQAVAYTPTPPTNSTVAAPIPPFAYVLLALLFAGASLLRLRK
jgi:hypothetical protein